MKKLYSSILTLLILIGLFTTVAYAWISLATINHIEDLKLSAMTAFELEMSVDGINYSNQLSSDEILSEIKGLRFIDVTSNDGINFSHGYHQPSKARVNKDYMSIVFHFRTTSDYIEIHLADNVTEDIDYNNPPEHGTYITSEGVMFQSKTTFNYDQNTIIEKDDINKFYARDAMRVSLRDINSNNKAKIFDLSNDQERGYGEVYGALSYLNSFSNQNILPPIDIPNTIYELSKFSNEDPIALSYESRIITLKKDEDDRDSKTNKPYYKGSVEMNVWLEGWDADAFDAIYKDMLKMQFTFKAVKVEGALE